MELEDERISNNIVVDVEEEENNKNKNSSSSISSEAAVVRSRWSPKPEQILILESIFNSGMVNPPKEETVRIRRLLEKFGAVGDANVFYWFQNRRSRSRRRQRQQQIQQQQQQQHMIQIQPPQVHVSTNNHDVVVVANNYDQTQQLQLLMMSDLASSSSSIPSTNCFSSPLYPPDVHFFQSPVAGMMTVFINGVATEVPKSGPIEVKPMFGEDVVLVHSSGVALPTDEFGILLHTLHPGESYFLVPRPTVSSYST